MQLAADQNVNGALLIAARLSERALHERFIEPHGEYHGPRLRQPER